MPVMLLPAIIRASHHFSNGILLFLCGRSWNAVHGRLCPFSSEVVCHDSRLRFPPRRPPGLPTNKLPHHELRSVSRTSNRSFERSRWASCRASSPWPSGAVVSRSARSRGSGSSCEGGDTSSSTSSTIEVSFQFSDRSMASHRCFSFNSVCPSDFGVPLDQLRNSGFRYMHVTS